MNIKAFYRNTVRSATPVTPRMWAYYAHKFLGMPNIYRALRYVRRMSVKKGSFAYESQIGPLVVMWRHDGKPWSCKRSSNDCLTMGKLHIWKDSTWRE